MHQQATTLLHEASGVLVDTANRLKRLEQRMGTTAVSIQTPSPPQQAIPSQPEKDRDPWLWLKGERTRDFKAQLREAGGRWSRKNKSWYFINCTELPEHLACIPGTEITVTY